MNQVNAPIIETIINTTALALTAAGTSMAVGRDWFGILLIFFGAALEFSKYYGRKKKLWK